MPRGEPVNVIQNFLLNLLHTNAPKQLSLCALYAKLNMQDITNNKINIVCAIKTFGNTLETINASENPDLQGLAEYTPARQRGTWNKSDLKFFVKGEPDELFAERDAFIRRVFNVAATEWDIELDITITQVYDESLADIIIEFGLKANDRYYADAGNVLAYAGYPDGSLKGYMKIFTDWDWDVKGSLNFVSMVIHELGHILGRPHSERGLWQDIMDPAINSNVKELSDFDILGGTNAYGARVYSSDEAKDRLEKANRKQKERLVLETLPIVHHS